MLNGLVVYQLILEKGTGTGARQAHCQLLQNFGVGEIDNKSYLLWCLEFVEGDTAITIAGEAEM